MSMSSRLVSRRNSYLLRTYGVTEEQYNSLLEKQGGGCAICGKTPEQEGKSLALDHDHHSREVRGILCGYHNKYTVGRHRDANLLRKVADYLDGPFTGWFTPEKRKRRKRKRYTKA